MKKLVLILLILLCPYQIFAQSFGMLLNDTAFQKAPHISPALRFSDAERPPVYSLKKYCPTIGDQNPMGSCAAWSSGYAALTISWAVKYNVTSKIEIDKNAKSPLFIYNQMKGPDQPDKDHPYCNVGLFLSDVMNWLEKNGDCELTQFNPNNCAEHPSAMIQRQAQKFPIETCQVLVNEYDHGAAYKIDAIINSISQNKPAVAGFNVYPSLTSEMTSKSAIWQIGMGERPVPMEGHAMCIIGYDNNAREFEIMNSWGRNFGNGGFFKISYDDFAKACNYAFNIKLGYTKEELDKMLTLTGDFSFKKFLRVNEKTNQNEFVNVGAELSGDHYTFSAGSVKKDDFYRIVVSNAQKDSYLYVFSLKPDHTCEVLFPLSASIATSKINDIALIPASGASVELPADDAKAYSTDIPGEDILCLLYSNQQIPDIKKIASNVNTMQGDIFDRLQKALGNRLVPSKKINYEQHAMSFSTYTGQGNIVPIILKATVTE